MGKFVLGFAVGVAGGVAYVLLTTPKTGLETRRSIKLSTQSVMDVARAAASAREQELWAKFRAELASRSAPQYPPVQLGY